MARAGSRACTRRSSAERGDRACGWRRSVRLGESRERQRVQDRARRAHRCGCADDRQREGSPLMSTREQRPQSFPDVPRVDAHDKVRGATRYAADNHPPNLAYAMLAVAQIGRGRITRLDVDAARAVRGVELVLTHLDMTAIKAD